MQKIPKHIAIICDGNRRWAREQGLKVFAGHKKAVDENFENLIEHAMERGIKYLTFWIFSTENWKRDKTEVDFLMNLFRKIFDENLEDWKEKGVRVRMIGDPKKFDEDIQERISRGQKETKENDKLNVVLAMNYGGRDELKRAVQKIAAEVSQGTLNPDEITEKTISAHLDTADIPDPDCIIRTSGEQRLSGFMSWQQEYAEFIFVDETFPEFYADNLDECIAEYNSRDRRFGGK